MTQQISRLPKVSGVCPEVLSMFKKIFQISQNFLHLSGNVQQVSRICVVLNIYEYIFFYHMEQIFFELQKKFSVCLEIFHRTQR